MSFNLVKQVRNAVQGKNESITEVVSVFLSDSGAEFPCVDLICTGDEVLQLHCKVDLVITLGGDGTVLWVNIFFNPVLKGECTNSSV